jgi:hypothetical protein
LEACPVIGKSVSHCRIIEKLSEGQQAALPDRR